MASKRKRPPPTLENILGKIRGKWVPDQESIDTGIKMNADGVPGWSMHFLRGFGIKPENVPQKIGFCDGCLSSTIITAWFMQQLTELYENDEVVMSRSYVMLLPSDFDPLYRGEPFPSVEWEEQPYHDLPVQTNTDVLEECVRAFRTNEKLRWYVFLTEVRGGSGKAHEMFTVVNRDAPGHVSLKVETFDPYGYGPTAYSVDEFFKRAIAAVSPDNPFTYVISQRAFAQCGEKAGVQSLQEAGRSRQLEEPDGYCATWSSIFILINFFVGPKSLALIQDDLVFCVSPGGRTKNWPTNLVQLARVVSRGFAHIFYTQAGPPPAVCKRVGICCYRDVSATAAIPKKYEKKPKRDLMEYTSLCETQHVYSRTPD